MYIVNLLSHRTTKLAVASAWLSLGACSPQEPSTTAPTKTDTPTTAAVIGIVPAPQTLTYHDDTYFTFNAQTQLVVTDPRFTQTAQYWADKFANVSNISLPLTTENADHNRLTFLVDSQLGPEEYRLDITATGIDIYANTAAGAFYALQSLRQLLPAVFDADTARNATAWRAPAVSVSDSPQYTWRGMHLDVGRSFMPVWFIKRYIDLLAMHKLNRFHWHLTEDQGWRVPIDAYPLLTETAAWRDKTVVGHTLDANASYDNKPTGGYYTKAQIQDIVRYAQQRHITVVPEIDIPGHASALLHAYPEFGCSGERPEVEANFGVFKPTLCPTEATFAMLETVFTEIAALFPGDYIHVGGDEVRKDEWQNSDVVSQLMAEHHLEDYHEVQSYFIGRVGDIIAKLDRKMIGWNEILDGGIAPDAIIMSWQGIAGGIEAAKLGHDAIMTPGNYTYFDHFQSRSIDEPMAIHGITPLSEVYSYNPVPEELAGTPEAKHILGVQGQLWSEYQTTPRDVEYMVLPRMSALAEIAWTAPDKQHWLNFSQRLPRLFDRFDAMGLNAARSVYATHIHSQRNGHGETATHTLSFSADVDSLEWLYSTDGSEPGLAKAIYSQPLTISGDTFVRVKARSKLTGELFPESVLRSVTNKITGATVSLQDEGVDRDWNTSPELTLVDGISKVDQIFQLDDWATFKQGYMAADIHVDDAVTVTTVSLGYNPGIHRQMHAPTRVDVWSSDDGEQWQLRQSAQGEQLQRDSSRVSVTLEPFTTQYLRIIASNHNKVLDTQTKTDMGVTLYIDEIVVQ